MNANPTKQTVARSVVAGLVILFILNSTVSAQILQQIKTVFVIPLENHDWVQACPTCSPQQLLGNPAAPYVNSLITPGNSNAVQVSYATKYYSVNIKGEHPSEPNYVWSEAGTDFGVQTDNDPSTGSGNLFTCQHLSGQLTAAGIAWKSYQEDFEYTSKATVSESGTRSSGTNIYNGSKLYAYAVKHNPMEFFTDTTNKNVYTMTQFWTDLTNNAIGRYNWITPDLYNEMHSYLSSYTYHGTNYSGDQAAIAEGDNCLSIIIPKITNSAAYKDHGVIIIWTDETESTDDTNTTLSYIIISPLAKGNAYASTLPYSHSSDLKTMDEIFGLAYQTNAIPTTELDAQDTGYDYVDGRSATINDMSDMFQAGCTPPATPTASNNGPICAGGTLTLSTPTVSGATYSWTGPNSFTSSAQNPSIASATTAASGTYSVTVTTNGCTSAAGTTAATVNAIPATPTASNNGPICAGSTLTLSTPTVSGATYSWTGPNSFSSTQQNPSIATATTAASGTYSVTVTVNGCPSAAGTTAATVNAIPATPTASNNGPICASSTLTLSTPTVSGATYSWTGPNSFSSTQQNPSITSATTAASGTYGVTVTVNGCPSAAGTTAATVNAIPATPTASNNGPICAGSELDLSTPTVSGATYSWTGPNGFSSPQQNPSIASAPTAASGTYSVTVTVNGCPSAAGTTAATVNAIPATPTAGNNGPILAGSELDLSTPTVTGATYSWTGPNGFTSTQQNPSIPDAMSAASGTYSVTVTDTNGCTSAAGSTTVLVMAPRITSITMQGSDILITWATTGGTTNAVEATPGDPGYNTNFVDISGSLFILGSGDTSTNYVDSGAVTNSRAKFYRVRLIP